MLSPSQDIPAKWSRHSTNINPLSFKSPWTQERLTLPHVWHSDQIKAASFPGEPFLRLIPRKLHLCDWSYTVAPTLCTCQEPPEQSQGWMRSSERPWSWCAKGSGTEKVPQQSRGLKGLVAAGEGSAAAGEEPLQYVHPHANTATGIPGLRLSHYTDKLVLSTVGCQQSD